MSSVCNTCQKTSEQVTLKRCAKCSFTQYCSRECQKADWKAHRKVCGKQQQPRADDNDPSSHSNSNASRAKGLDKHVEDPFGRLDKGTWLHDRPEKDVYRLLIDAYRMRVEDRYALECEIDQDSIYSGASDGLKGFQRFLDLVESRRSLLPSWWNAEKRKECEAFGMDTAQWQDLRCAIEKHDVIDHYGDQWFPMQLRMFAQEVTGRGVGGADAGAAARMRQMMMAMESGGL